VLTVGFDLDMTLIDARPGMVSCMAELARETGFDLDGEYFAANLGPPLAHILAEFGVPEPRIDAMVARFRELYPPIVIPGTVALPGADAALRAVREAGGRILVVTGKYQPNAALHVAALGWEVDWVIGELWAAGKGEALRAHQARIYVGDHTGDMLGARAAGSYPVGVTTGPCDVDQLRAAGAEVVLPDLTRFGDWLGEHLAAPREPDRSAQDRNPTAPARPRTR
jgi:phosphoglycolate phosphatase